MCNQYRPPESAEAERFWRIHEGRGRTPLLPPIKVFPRSQAPFIRRARHETGYERELVVEQWDLIPWFAKDLKLKYATNIARGGGRDEGQLQGPLEARAAVHHSGPELH